MSGADDDDGTVIIIQKRAKEIVSAPVTMKRWHMAAVVVAAFVLGLVF